MEEGKPQDQNKSNNKQGEESLLKKWYTKLVLFGGALALIASIIANLSSIGSFFTDKVFRQKSTEIIFQDTSKYNILLLPFGPDGTCELEKNLYHHQVHRRLLRLIEGSDLSIEVKRRDTIMCDLIDYRSVEEYSNMVGADLTIYGNYQERCDWDTTLINIRYISNKGIGDLRTGETGYKRDSDYSVLQNLSNGAYTGNIEDVIYFFLGIAEFNNENWSKSLELINKVTIRGKDSTKVMAVNLFKGFAYFQLERFSHAPQHFEITKKYIQEPEILEEMNFLIGLSYSNAKKYAKSIDYLLAYPDTGDYFVLSSTILSDSYAHLGDYISALKVTSKVIDRKLTDRNEVELWQTYMQRAFLYEVLDDYDNAIADANSALELYPRCESCKEALLEWSSSRLDDNLPF